MEKNEALDELTDLKFAIRKAEQDLRATVAEARVSGASWTDIGAQLGISKQAAQQQFSDYLPNTYRCNCGWSHIIPTTPERCTRETAVVLAHIDTAHPEIKAAQTTAADPTEAPEPREETNTSPTDLLEALGPSDTTRKFYETALERGFTPEVEFKADNSQLIITVNGPAPSRGWLMLSQFPSSQPGRHKHYFQYASMRTFTGKNITRDDAMRTLRTWNTK